MFTISREGLGRYAIDDELIENISEDRSEERDFTQSSEHTSRLESLDNLERESDVISSVEIEEDDEFDSFELNDMMTYDELSEDDVSMTKSGLRGMQFAVMK